MFLICTDDAGAEAWLVAQQIVKAGGWTELDRLAGVLRGGGLVAFPTETVYGLGADATDADAVAAIYRAKGRPGDNPLIVHAADAPDAAALAGGWPETAARLAAACWPGPLTLVVPAGPRLAPAVTAGTGNVGLRVPGHDLARRLIRAAGVPVAAPSANRSERVSPTTAAHVRAELPGVPVLDGGPCPVGIESTVVRCARDRVTVLRPGSVTPADLRRVLPGVEVVAGTDGPASASPGRRERHYAPAAPCRRFGPGDPVPPGVAVLCLTRRPEGPTWRVMPPGPAEYGRALYATLREIDARGPSAIWVEMPPAGQAWDAVRDRMTRASVPAERGDDNPHA